MIANTSNFRWLATGLAAWALTAAPLRADDAKPQADRSATAILEELEATQPPTVDRSRREDRAYVNAYIEKLREVKLERAELIGELFEADPEHPQLPRLMNERWQTLSRYEPNSDAVQREIETILAEDDHPLAADAAYMNAQLAVRPGPGQAEPAAALAAIDTFIERAPEDDARAASLLYQASRYLRPLDTDTKAKLLQRIVDEYPDSRVASYAQGALRQSNGVGKPFELTFNDAISGETISVQDDLKGKVVVIDFWATWCGPCVAEMPEMKRIYAEYKDEGVEFIGVSLDQPGDGLQQLKTFVEENEIPWPQYYQGNGWDSEFSSGWGISAIPTMFILDKRGRLHSTEARGRLETLIPELLKQDAGAGEE